MRAVDPRRDRPRAAVRAARRRPDPRLRPRRRAQPRPGTDRRARGDRRRAARSTPGARPVVAGARRDRRRRRQSGSLLDLTLMQPVYRQHGEQRVLLGLLLMLGVAFVIDGLLVWRYPIEALSLRIGGDPVDDPRRADAHRRAAGVGDRPGRRRVLVAFFRLHDARQGRALGDPGRGGRPAVRHQPGDDAHARLRAERCARRARRGHPLDDRRRSPSRRASTSRSWP